MKIGLLLAQGGSCAYDISWTGLIRAKHDYISNLHMLGTGGL